MYSCILSENEKKKQIINLKLRKGKRQSETDEFLGSHGLSMITVFLNILKTYLSNGQRQSETDEIFVIKYCTYLRTVRERAKFFFANCNFFYNFAKFCIICQLFSKCLFAKSSYLGNGQSKIEPKFGCKSTIL